MICQKNESIFDEINLAEIKITASPPTVVDIPGVLSSQLGRVTGYVDVFLVFLFLPDKFLDHVSIMSLPFPSRTFPTH
jgi:hypothetical protein